MQRRGSRFPGARVGEAAGHTHTHGPGSGGPPVCSSSAANLPAGPRVWYWTKWRREGELNAYLLSFRLSVSLSAASFRSLFGFMFAVCFSFVLQVNSSVQCACVCLCVSLSLSFYPVSLLRFSFYSSFSHLLLPLSFLFSLSLPLFAFHRFNNFYPSVKFVWRSGFLVFFFLPLLSSFPPLPSFPRISFLMCLPSGGHLPFVGGVCVSVYVCLSLLSSISPFPPPFPLSLFFPSCLCSLLSPSPCLYFLLLSKVQHS